MSHDSPWLYISNSGEATATRIGFPEMGCEGAANASSQVVGVVEVVDLGFIRGIGQIVSGRVTVNRCA